MKLKNYSIYGGAFLVITIISLLLADITLLPLIHLQLKNPQVFNYLLLILILCWFVLKILLQYRQEKSEISSTTRALLTATTKVSIQAIYTLGKLLRFALLFTLFVSILALALTTNNQLLFK